MKKTFFVVLAVLLCCLAAFAQFGGRIGDVVLFVVSAKGDRALKTVPATTTNTQTGFVIEDPKDLPDEPFGPDFPGESRRMMHKTDGDVFNMIIQREGIRSPHQFLQGPVKVMIEKGLLRLFPPAGPVDAPVGFYAPFPDKVDFGPNEPLFDGVTLMWTPYPEFPVAKKAPPDYFCPPCPPGVNGIDFLLSRGTFVGIVPWVSLHRKNPDAGWPLGVDTKLLEDDQELGATVQLIRLRPGKITPLFRIDANTHIWVLSGRVMITPAQGSTSVMKTDIYAFVPNGFAIRLSNPAEYQPARF